VANKFAQDRSRRHQTIGDAEETGQESQQPPRLGVLRMVRVISTSNGSTNG